MKKRLRIRVVLMASVVLLIVVSNIYSGVINVFVEGIGKSYAYSTESGAFTDVEIPTKGRDISMVEQRFQLYLDKNPPVSDTVLYRTFKPNLLEFWNWYSYVTHERYKYKYLKN